MNTESLGTELGFCAQTAGAWQLAGLLLVLFKIIVPIILIVIGVITLGKAVISDDEKDIKKGFNSLIKKFIVGVCIFFIPTLVTALFSIVTDFDDVKDDYNVCKNCIVHPRGTACTSKIAIEKSLES